MFPDERETLLTKCEKLEQDNQSVSEDGIGFFAVLI